MKKKAVVLASGGLDSTVLLHFLKAGLMPCMSWHSSMDNGISGNSSVHDCKANGRALAFNCVPMSFLGELLQASSTLMETGGPVPNLADIPETLRDQPPTYVPHRNMLFLSIAAAYAESIDIDRVFTESGPG